MASLKKSSSKSKAPTIGFTVEIISAIIRGGPQHRVLGDPFAYAVVVASVDGKVGVVKALNGKDGDFGPEYLKPALRLIREKLGLKPDWIRLVPGRQKRRHKRATPKPSL